MRTFRPRKIMATVAAASAALALAACSSGNSQAGASQSTGETTIRVLVPTNAVQEGVTALAQDFQQANPNIKIEIQGAPSATYSQVLLTDLQSGSAPDVVYTNGGSGVPESVLSLGKSGQLADLSSQTWKQQIPASAHDLYWSGSKLYGLPLDLNVLGIVYNTDQFKSLGLNPPSTFADLLGLCKTIKGKGLVPISVPGQVPYLLGEMMAANSVYSQQPSWNAQRAKNKVTFAGTPGWHTVLQHYEDMNNAGCFPQGVQSLSVPQSFSLIGSGQALMYTGPSTGIAAIQKVNPKINLSMAAFPADSANGTRVTAGYVDALSVSAHSSHVSQATKFLSYFTQSAPSAKFAQIAGVISLSDASSGSLPAAYGQVAKYLGKAIPRPQDSWPNGQVSTALGNAMTAVLTGQGSIDSGLQQVDAAWKQSS